jgi:hypothetical protein
VICNLNVGKERDIFIFEEKEAKPRESEIITKKALMKKFE